MYKKGFYLEGKKGNNAFSLVKRPHKKIYIPGIIDIKSIDEIKLQTDKKKIAFEEYDIDGELQTCYGLENFYRLNWNGIELILFDNHNHAHYFWYEAKSRGIIGDNNILYHIDEHADTRDNGNYLPKNEARVLKKVFEYTNNVLNVGNYIIPALKEGLITEIIQIRNETNLKDYLSGKLRLSGDIILNIDLDFFKPDLDYIDYEMKKEVILNLASNAKLITVATSPFFINQQLALKVFKDIFGKKENK